METFRKYNNTYTHTHKGKKEDKIFHNNSTIFFLSQKKQDGRLAGVHEKSEHNFYTYLQLKKEYCEENSY